ncbi:MAG TPA: cytochrome c-type biogenesis protein [Stellaceae bacterium]|nr:cytochrome c-type biogenesis protein [Stellaceae bacterium]
MKRLALAVFYLMALVVPALAVEPNERLADPALEARARAVGRELRCLVCQNESIDESGADLAHDLRVILRERIQAGDSDAQAIKYLTDRYGDFVLLKPPVEPATYLLWFSPLLLIMIGGGGIALYLRRHRPEPDDTPLSAPERNRLDRLLRGEGE